MIKSIFKVSIKNIESNRVHISQFSEIKSTFKVKIKTIFIFPERPPAPEFESLQLPLEPWRGEPDGAQRQSAGAQRGAAE